MNRVLLAVVAVLVASLAVGAQAARVDLDRVAIRADGRDDASVRRALRANAPSLFGGDAMPELELVTESESLTGRHFRYVQKIDGEVVIGGEVAVTVDGAAVIRSIHSRTAVRPVRPVSPMSDRGVLARLRALHPELSGGAVLSSAPALLNVEGAARHVIRIETAEHPVRPIAWYLDAATGELLRIEPLYFNDAAARVFVSNPVTHLNDPSLQDRDDAATAVPNAAYAQVILRDLAPSGRLSGPYVTIVDSEAPSPSSADASQPLLFDRSQSGFEEVMAYYHLDASQRYMQSLGYTGSRQILKRPVVVDAHAANGDDNSYYRPGATGGALLFFGDGGVDDAEDPDILLHEYGHAIQDAIAPGAFNGSFASEARALGEGFGDYWAFSQGYAASDIAGRDPFCIADWDARCGDSISSGCSYAPGADCLRRVDGAKTMADYIRTERSGVEHRNGEIWSSALRQIFVAIVASWGSVEGRIITDTLVLESHFGVPPLPTFNTLARRMIDADRILYGGSHVPVICGAMASRGIFASADCDFSPKGDVTLYQGPQRDLPIPDGFSSLVLSKEITDARLVRDVHVRVDIRHPFRGDLRVLLTSPDGVSRVLLDRSGDVGADLHATYGVDAEPVQSLDVYRGKPANGRWQLTVIDGAARDAGTLLSWGLVFRFEGDEALAVRAAATGATLHLLAAGHTPGAENTEFLTDVRIHNRGGSAARTTAFFTRSGYDGRSSFAAINIDVPPGATVALDDVVDREFRTLGVGAIEFRGDVRDLLITSRTYNRTAEGTFGQFIPAVPRDIATAAGRPPIHVNQLQNTDAFRANLGFAELSGNAGTIEVRLFDTDGVEVESGSRAIEPFGHYQFPILGGRVGTFHDRIRAEIRVIEGAAEVAAYGSVVDNVSGDPIYVPAVAAGTAPQPLAIPAAIHAGGAFGTAWRTDLWLANPSTSPVSADISYHPAAGGPPLSESMTVPPGSIRAIDDVALARFGVSNGSGHLRIDAGGPLLATSRTWTDSAAGSHGQFIGSVPVSSAIAAGGRATAIQIESSAMFRTNVGVAEVAGAPVTVRFLVLDAAGSTLASGDREVPAKGQLQLSVVELGAVEFTSGRVDIEVLSGSGRVLGYASVIDNRTGDPIYIPATPDP